MNCHFIFYRLGYCEVCSSDAAKYCCPRCEVKTCSLSCVNIHKKELECDGKKYKTGFKKLEKFNDFEMSQGIKSVCIFFKETLIIFFFFIANRL